MTYVDDRPVVGANGDVYVAPVGTAIPAAWAALDSSPWVKLGLISEDGATWTPPSETTSDINAWQTPFPVRILTTALTTSIQFGLMEWDRNTVPAALGGGTFDDTGTELVVYHPPGPGESIERALFLEVLDTPFHMGVYYGRSRITARDDVVFKKDSAALLSCTFSILGNPTGDPYNVVFDKAEFQPAAGPPATGATAGTPGTFTPSGAVAPANLAAMTGKTANPATAWTTGQYVVLGDNSHAHWNATAWVAGNAP